MTYTYTYNPARKIWMVWGSCGGYGAEVVKTFKTEAAAAKYCKLHNEQ